MLCIASQVFPAEGALPGARSQLYKCLPTTNQMRSSCRHSEPQPESPRRNTNFIKKKIDKSQVYNNNLYNKKVAFSHFFSVNLAWYVGEIFHILLSFASSILGVYWTPKHLTVLVAHTLQPLLEVSFTQGCAVLKCLLF